MQRKSIRATVGGLDVDIAATVFVNNQFVFFDGTNLVTRVAVTPVGIPATGNLASWAGATTIQDSGITLANVVTNPTASLPNQVATFTDTTGKVIQATSVLIIGSAISVVTTINGRFVDDFVTGPASAVDGRITVFDGATGKAVRDSGVAIANIVTSASTPLANQVVTFTGAGRAVANSAVLIIGQAISNVTTINGRTVDDFITGPASAGNGNVLAFNGTTGKAANDSGVLAANLVTTTATPAADRVASFTGSGKAIKDAGLHAPDLVTNSSAATSGNVAVFNGPSGKLIFDSPAVPAANLVTSTSSPSANQVATFTGTGKAVQSTSATISGSTLSGITVVNGVTIASHASRHLPGGSDSMFTTLTFRQNAIPMYRGTANGDVFYTMHYRSSVCNSVALSSTFQIPAALGTLIYAHDVGGANMPLNPDAPGDYLVEWNFVIDVADSITGDLEFRTNWSSGSGTAILTMCGAGAANAKYATASATALAFTITGAPTGVFSVRCTLGLTSAAAGSNVSFAIRKTSGTANVIARGTCFAQQVSANV